MRRGVLSSATKADVNKAVGSETCVDILTVQFWLERQNITPCPSHGGKVSRAYEKLYDPELPGLESIADGGKWLEFLNTVSP